MQASLELGMGLVLEVLNFAEGKNVVMLTGLQGPRGGLYLGPRSGFSASEYCRKFS